MPETPSQEAGSLLAARERGLPVLEKGENGESTDAYGVPNPRFATAEDTERLLRCVAQRDWAGATERVKTLDWTPALAESNPLSQFAFHELEKSHFMRLPSEGDAAFVEAIENSAEWINAVRERMRKQDKSPVGCALGHGGMLDIQLAALPGLAERVQIRILARGFRSTAGLWADKPTRLERLVKHLRGGAWKNREFDDAHKKRIFEAWAPASSDDQVAASQNDAALRGAARVFKTLADSKLVSLDDARAWLRKLMRADIPIHSTGWAGVWAILSYFKERDEQGHEEPARHWQEWREFLEDHEMPSPTAQSTGWSLALQIAVSIDERNQMLIEMEYFAARMGIKFGEGEEAVGRRRL